MQKTYIDLFIEGGIIVFWLVWAVRIIWLARRDVDPICVIPGTKTVMSALDKWKRNEKREQIQKIMETRG